MKISYECEDLIQELEEDIKEFGDFEAYAFFEKVQEYMFITNYDFIEEEAPLESKELLKDTVVQIMKATDILKILKEQNRII